MGPVRIAVVLLFAASGVGSADPAPSTSSPSPSPTTSTPAPPTRTPLVLTPLSLIETTPSLPAVSLRLEAARIAAERFEDNWRFPEPGPIIGLDGNAWFVGAGHYRPRNARSAALHGGSMGATMLGEILVGSGSPLAGVGALLTGATLDAAAADVDRDAEAAHPKQ
jgi:hypothetical protein